MSMFSFLEKAKDAVRGAAGKVKDQANGMAKLLNARVQVVGAGSYLVDPERLVLPVSQSPTATLLAMKFPVEQAETVCSGQADLGAMAAHLNARFGARYLVVNLSDVPYDATAFRGQVLEFFFPGYPAPPVKVIVQMCVAVDAWLAGQRKAKEMQKELALPPSDTDAAGGDGGGRGSRSLRSVATGAAEMSSAAAAAAAASGGGADESQPPPAVLFHCKTGKGRTAVALACYLAWANLCPSPVDALDRVCAALAMPVEMVTIPSQRRYVEYFTNILDGAKPAARKLILSRVIVHSVPQFGAASPGTAGRQGRPGCHPELRVVKNGKVVFRAEHATANLGATAGDGGGGGGGGGGASASAAFSAAGGGRGDAGTVRAGDGGIKFVVNLETAEDVVLSCYHVEPRGTAPGSRWKRVFMFRAQFYTGFVKENMLRFTRASLDGTTDNAGRFPHDFFVEAFFDSHPVGNDFRLPASWKAIHERTRRLKAAQQAARERAERKEQRRREKEAKKALKKQRKKSKKGAARSGSASSTPSATPKSTATTAATPKAQPPAAAAAAPVRRSSSDAGAGDDAYYSDGSDSDSTASGASTRAAEQAASPAGAREEFEIIFSDGEEEEDDDAAAAAASGGGEGARLSVAPLSAVAAVGATVPAAPAAPAAAATTAAAAAADGAHRGVVAALVRVQAAAADSLRQPAAAEGAAAAALSAAAAGAKPAAAVKPARLQMGRLHADSPSPTTGLGGSTTSPSSTTTVENSDGWDGCATDTNDGVLALGTDDDDDNDAALADIESFLSNLDSM